MGFFAPSILKPGQPVSDFQLLDQHGRSVSLAECRQQARGAVLLFFASDFLKADREALLAYREAYPQFQAAGVALFAISGINWEKLHHLGQRLALPYSVLFDPCCRYAKQFGVMWVPKFINGRAVFAISPEGNIVFSALQASPHQALQTLL